MSAEKSNKEKKLSLRGRTFVGSVVSNSMHKTIVVEWETREFIPKYERYKKKRSRVYAHAPEDADIDEGDRVKVMETRPISKTKSFTFVENLSKRKQK
ncbi:MAG: 30S ribosomal protein S17 [Nanobdellota archaeon]